MVTDTGASEAIRAIWDTEAQVNLITKGCVDDLGLSVSQVAATMAPVAGAETVEASQLVTAEICTLNEIELDLTIQFFGGPLNNPRNSDKRSGRRVDRSSEEFTTGRPNVRCSRTGTSVTRCWSHP